MRRLAQAPQTPFIDGRKSVASLARANMRAKPEGAEILRSGKRLPRRAIALGYSRKPCAGSRKHRRPRSSMVENRLRRGPTPICVQNPRGPKSFGPANCLCVPLAVEPEVSPLKWVPTGYQGRYQPGTRGRTFPSASMPASGPRHARGPSPSPIRLSKRPLPIHSTRCATYTIVVTVASPVTTRVPRASCRTVPSAWADGPMPASGAPHVRCPLPSPIRPSKRPLPIHSTRCHGATCHGASNLKP
jgi:hypothetical protein